MAQDDEKDEGAIHRVDTVPPPAGEDDAYNAPTKVGSISPELLQVLRDAHKAAAPADAATTSSAPLPPPAPLPRPMPLPDLPPLVVEEPSAPSEWDEDESVQVMDRPVLLATSPASPALPTPREVATSSSRPAPASAPPSSVPTPPSYPPSTLGRESLFVLVLLVASIVLGTMLGPR